MSKRRTKTMEKHGHSKKLQLNFDWDIQLFCISIENLEQTKKSKLAHWLHLDREKENIKNHFWWNSIFKNHFKNRSSLQHLRWPTL